LRTLPFPVAKEFETSTFTKQKGPIGKNHEALMCQNTVFSVCYDMLKTYDVLNATGQIRFATSTEKGLRLTVECYDRNTAFVLEIPERKYRIGQWVKIRGQVRADFGINKNGELRENIKYYHDPLNGTPKENWANFIVRHAKIDIVPPPGFEEKMMEVRDKLSGMIQKWDQHQVYNLMEDMYGLANKFKTCWETDDVDYSDAPVQVVSVEL
jgi:hypothetical protein